MGACERIHNENVFTHINIKSFDTKGNTSMQTEICKWMSSDKLIQVFK